MNIYSARWISRKEIAFLIGRTYNSVQRSEAFLGLTKFRIRVNSRVVIFRREETINKLKEAGLL